MRFVVLGAPGSGKGTIADELTAQLGIPHISTGDIFRANIKNETQLGKVAKSFIDQGLLVPDDITNALVAERFRKEDCENGFLLDGYPRTIQQAQELEKLFYRLNYSLDAVIFIKVSHEIIKERVSLRRVCISCGASYNMDYKPTKVFGKCDLCGGDVIQREDDQPETVQVGLETYAKKTAPLISFYEQKNVLIYAENEIDSRLTLKQIKKDLHARGIL